jgi:predicted ATPase
MRGELGVGEETVRQLLRLAESTGDRVARLGAHNMAGLMAFYRGQLVAALAHFEEAGALYDPEEHSPNRLSELSVDHDIGVSCMAHTALTQLLLGYPDRAAASMRKCLGYAHTIDHPLSLVMALNFAAFLHHVRRDRSALEEIENERHALATAHGFELFLWFGDIFGGWLTAEAGRGEDGVVQIRRGLEIYRFVGGALGAPTFFAILAEAYGGVGRLDEGRAAVEEGLAVAEQTGFHYWDAELLRRKAELAPASAGAAATRAAPVAKTAEASLLAAIEIARSQEARLLELRAATSLSRLWRRRGRADDARSLLSGIHAWFSEGFETPDFREAKAILDEIDGDRPSKPRARSR